CLCEGLACFPRVIAWAGVAASFLGWISQSNWRHPTHSNAWMTPLLRVPVLTLLRRMGDAPRSGGALALAPIQRAVKISDEPAEADSRGVGQFGHFGPNRASGSEQKAGGE